MNQTIKSINGDVFAKKRKILKISAEYLARSTCLSINQIQQIEGGGQQFFYSFANKVNAAKKVAAYLEIPYESAFIYQKIEVIEAPPPPKAEKKVTLIKESLRSRFFLPQIKQKSIALLSIMAMGVGASLVSVYFNTNDASLSNKGQLDDQIVNLEPKKLIEVLPEANTLNSPNLDVCEIVVPSAIAMVRVKNPQYPGDSISIRSSVNMDICITDGGSEKRKYTLEENTKRIIPVRSKFVILGQDLTPLTLYFQGERVRVSDGQKSVLSVGANPAYSSDHKRPLEIGSHE